jgi:hypothetical protein
MRSWTQDRSKRQIRLSGFTLMTDPLFALIGLPRLHFLGGDQVLFPHVDRRLK